MTWRTVTLAVDTETDAAFIDAHEQLSRICAGMVLAGRPARVFSYECEEAEAEA